MNLIALPAFTDHRIRMLHDDHQTLVVDPGESAPVTGVPDSLRLVLAAILVTHHHGNHALRTSTPMYRSLARRADAAGMRGAEPGTGLAALRQWKNDLR